MTGAAGDDPRMDLYAVGIILFEMLTGKAPFESKASDPALYWVEMRELHQREPLPALAPLGVSPELEKTAKRATAKRLEDRYQSAEEMLDDVRGLRHTEADAATVVLGSSRLNLTTTPGGAEVYVDDLLHGTSDAARGKLLVDGLTPGLHRVRVLKEGFNEYKINVALEEGRQTDLQVAIPARATVAMPAAESTAAGGLDTLRFQSSDEIKTAVLVVDSLPAGSTLFVGSEPVAHAGTDGRATLKLAPGSHEIRATAPTGATATRVVSVTPQESGVLKTMSLPLTQTTAAGANVPAGRSEQSRRGRQIAAAVVVILLLALAAAAFFVLKGPDRNREQILAVSVPPANPATPAGPEPVSAKPSEPSDTSQVNEEKKKSAEARKQAEQEAAALEAQKKAAESKEKDKKAATLIAPPATSPQPPTPTPPTASDPLPEPDRRATVPGRDGCLVVTVLDANDRPIQGAKIMVEGTSFGGRTGPKGHWQECSFTPGQSVRVVVFGPRGAIQGSQSAVVARPRTFVNIRVQKLLEDAPQIFPNRKRPFRQRP